MALFTLDKTVESTLSIWLTNLKNLSFFDNFRGYEWEGSILAGETKKIAHNLKVTPTRFVVTEAKDASTIIKGAPSASPDTFYLKNASSTSTFTGKVLLLP